MGASASQAREWDFRKTDVTGSLMCRGNPLEWGGGHAWRGPQPEEVALFFRSSGDSFTGYGQTRSPRRQPRSVTALCLQSGLHCWSSPHEQGLYDMVWHMLG